MTKEHKKVLSSIKATRTAIANAGQDSTAGRKNLILALFHALEEELDEVQKADDLHTLERRAFHAVKRGLITSRPSLWSLTNG